MLADPGVGLGSSLAPFLEGATFTEPHEVIEFADGDEIEYAGIRFIVDHTPPGHTQGSVVLRTVASTPPDAARFRSP